MLASAAGTHGIDKDNLDPSVRPGDDFYQYACGGWMAKHPLTPEYSRFGTFDMLRERAKVQLKDLITNLSKDEQSKVKGTNAQKVSDLYSMGMDSVRLNSEGAAPLKPFLDKINNSRPEDFTDIVAWMHNGVTNVFFSTAVGSDYKNSDRNIMHIGETGLGLGDRDYYLEKNEENDKILKAYENYVMTVMQLAGYSEADARRVWNNVITLETEFARNKKTREERRDANKRYNMMSYSEILSAFPNIEWDRYFKNLGVEDLKEANVSSVNFIKFLNEYLPTLTEQQRKDYMAFMAVADSSALLSDAFSDADFELYDKVMSGKQEKEPRWKTAMALPNSIFGEAVGELYVEKYFPKENKEYMVELVENLRNALGKHIDNLTWMSDETKAKAHEKLSSFKVKIGYPDKWRDYSGISIDPEKSYLENVYNASVWFHEDNRRKLTKPVDKEEWHMTPQTVNAYYSPQTNEICFPAAILQDPYFDVTADDAQNYGAIGVVIGHEMTHGFDDQGRKYDKDGNLTDWWQPQDAEEFKKLADALVAQFDEVEVLPGLHANGRFTLGENIADQGGLRVALTAYLDHMKDKKMEEIDGFSPLQRFYLSYANLWAGNIRDEEIRARTKSDSHSLGRNRTNVSVRNIAPFFEAFGIKEGDAMFRPESERVVIW
ncbi:MAG: M13 family metallopeptidase [Bacteroidales bacterium]|nr:M13 family metallopeptidase [Bacteroidales bacterium]MBD5221713.1 M13 family metallopeptidase [Bacteroidales bacterium]